VTDSQAAAAVQELSAAGLTIGESGAAALAGLRTLRLDPRAADLRGRLRAGRHTSVLVVATEGTTGAPTRPT
jgi:hypothetical protein